MRIITDFADQAVILPTVAMVLLTLLWLGWRRAALAWAGVTGGTLAMMAVLKVVFAACGPDPGPGMLADPSGHTAAAAAVYGGAVGLLLRGTVLRRIRFTGGLPWVEAGLAGLLLAGLVGTSRVLLGAHSVPDVIVGGLLGTASALLLALLAGPPQIQSAQRRWLLAPLVAVPLLLHGFHLNAEPRIKSVATFWPLSACRSR